MPASGPFRPHGAVGTGPEACLLPQQRRHESAGTRDGSGLKYTRYGGRASLPGQPSPVLCPVRRLSPSLYPSLFTSPALSASGERSFRRRNPGVSDQ